MKNSLRLAAMAVVAAVGLIALTPTAAHASKKGRRNTAIALGAVAAYGLIKKKPAIAGIAGAGAVYSWLQSNKVDDNRDRDRQRARQRNRRYQSRYAGDRYYDNGYRGRSYNPGYSGRAYNSGYSGRSCDDYDRGSYNRRSSYSRASHDNNGWGHGKKRGHGRHWD